PLLCRWRRWCAGTCGATTILPAAGRRGRLAAAIATTAAPAGRRSAAAGPAALPFHAARRLSALLEVWAEGTARIALMQSYTTKRAEEKEGRAKELWDNLAVQMRLSRKLVTLPPLSHLDSPCEDVRAAGCV
ncbi:hypothetical protein Vafri_5734, partial [Volvox africanus]